MSVPPRIAFSTLAFPDATLAAAAAAFAAARGCAAEPGLDALLARGDVDVVCVCVPSGLHAEVGVRAARAGKHLVVEKPIDVTLAAAFSEAYGLLRPYLVYLQVKDALAATGAVVPAGQGDGQVRETLAALRDSGFEGFMSLEPHLAQAGRYGGFSGPEGFRRASQALKFILNELSISW